MTFQQNSMYTDSLHGKPIIITNGMISDFYD